MLGLDYTSRIDPAALKQAGVAVVFRYTTWSGWPKSLTPAEADELHAAGIAVAANFESTADRMKGAGPAGHADATEALGHIADDHMPTGLKIWFSADWDVQDTEVILVLDYLHAAADALGGQQYVGLYGGYRAVSAAADAGFAIWQTSAWSYGRWDPRCAAKQDGGQAVIGGVQVDLNTIVNLPALGAWLPEGNDMTPDEHNALMAIKQSAVDFANWQFFSPPGREQVQGTHAWRMQSTLDNTNAIKAQLDKLTAAVAAVGTPVPATIDVPALAAALGPLLQTGPSADEVAVAVEAHFAAKLAA